MALPLAVSEVCGFYLGLACQKVKIPKSLLFSQSSKLSIYMLVCRFFEGLPKVNQRTNSPVNAHLKPEIYTNKLV